MTLTQPLRFSAITIAIPTGLAFVAALLPGLAIPEYLAPGLAIAAGLILLLLARDDWKPNRPQSLKIVAIALIVAPAILLATRLGGRSNDWLFRRYFARYEIIARAEPAIVGGREIVPLHDAPLALRFCCTYAERERWSNGYRELVLARFRLHGDRGYLYTIADTGSGVIPMEPVTVNDSVHMMPSTDVVVGSCQDDDLPPGWCRGQDSR